MSPVRATVLRSGSTVTLLLVVYYAAPPVPARASEAVVALVAAGAIGLVAVMARQFRAIQRSPTPRLRAIEALAVAAPLFLVVFASAYHALSVTDSASFTERLSRHDALYFAITVFSTTGFGDVAPLDGVARVLVSAQMIGGMVFMGLGIRILVTAAQIGVERRQPVACEPPDDGADSAG